MPQRRIAAPEAPENVIARAVRQQNAAQAPSLLPAHAPTDAKWAKYALPGPYHTVLPQAVENEFQRWVIANKVPFDSSPMADYDMRGFYQALINRDPMAKSQVSQNDQRRHYPDYWKTPYHQSFSNESRYAKPNAPRWINQSQLIDENGKIVFDERQIGR